jgi:hypothetical protein
MIIFLLNISPELKHSLYSSSLMCPQFCPFQLSQAFCSDLGALYGPLILHKPPASVHCTVLNTFKGNKYYSKFISSMTQRILVINIKKLKFGDMFRLNEPSSGQKHSTGTFSECVHYGIPYCLQIILKLKIMYYSVSQCI